ncbi:hypothetical protein GF377_10815 [candidate division GN15 bacterium]|nr:hypothetical protein [candidate division GN15 bacterium]
MTSVEKLRSYADIRDLVEPDAFTLTMQFLAWYNRQKMTDMMEVWRALAVAYACEQHPIDQLTYSGVQNYFQERSLDPPATVSGCKEIGNDLARYLNGE